MPFRQRDEVFPELRAERGLTWHEPLKIAISHEESGFRAVTRHADAKFVSRNSQLARVELRSLFFEMLTRLPTVALGTPEYLSSSTLHGINRVSVQRADRRGRLASRSN